MAIFTVHVPTDGDDAGDRAARTAFVRDGFSVPAFLFGPLYLLRCRAWLAAAFWVIVVLGIASLCHLVRMPFAVEFGLAVLIMLFTGLEANSVRRLALHRRGLDMVDVVEGATREEGERAFFRAATLRGLPARRTVSGPGAARPDEPVIGFFDAGPVP